MRWAFVLVAAAAALAVAACGAFARSDVDAGAASQAVLQTADRAG